MGIIWNSIKSDDPATLLEKSKYELYKHFIDANNIVGWCSFPHTPEYVAYSLYKKRGPLGRDCGYTHLAFDHPRMYKKDNNDRIFVAHVYLGNKVNEFAAKLESWATENGLMAEIYDPTYDWYYHSCDPQDVHATSLVIVHLRDVDVQL